MWAWLAGCASLDREVPELDVVAPADAVRETATLVIRAKDAAPGLATLTLAVDDSEPIDLPLPPTGELTWDLGVAALDDGVHRIVVRAVDRSWLGNAISVQVDVPVDHTPPALEVADVSLQAAQGRTLAVWVRADEALVEPRVGFADRDLPLFEVDGAWRSLIGLAIRQEPGPTPLVVTARDAAGNEARTEVEVQVAATEFEVGGFIRLSKKQKDARKDDEAIAKMRAERDGAYAVDDPEQRWTAPMGLPVVSARLTSPFGKYRSYSDGQKSYHTGLDLSRRRGVRVSAAEAGLVVIAHEQAIMGNVVMLDHGHGVTTSYNHLDRIDVEEGQVVARGDALGALGSTGQSTGPHLHWSLVVGREAVDPAQWLDTDFSTSPWSASPTGDGS